MLGMPDAAMVDQMASKEQVPDDMMVLWLASKGLPVTFASLVGRYRKLQDAAKNPMGGAQIPKTTVAEDVNSGLASLQQSAVPPMPELTQLQDQDQDQGQPQQQPQQQPQPQQMPPDQGQQMPQQGPAGLASLDPGAMGQMGMAGGGIIAFVGGGQGAQEQDQQNQEEALTAQLNQQQQQQQQAQDQAPAPAAPAPQQHQTYRAPTSLDQVFQQYGEGEEDINAAFDKQMAELDKMEVYEPKNSPAYDQERDRLINEKLADQNKMPLDQWEQLIAQGMAQMKEAQKPHEPGFGYMAATTAGLEAFYETGKKLEKEHETTQRDLDKAIIDQNRLEFAANETGRKEAIEARNAKRKEIMELQAKKLEILATKKYNLAQLGISAINARTAMTKAATGNPSNYDTQFGIELAALREENNSLPADQRLSDAQLRRKASNNVIFNIGQQERLRNTKDEQFSDDYTKELTSVRTSLADPSDRATSREDKLRYRQAPTAKEKEAIVREITDVRMSGISEETLPNESSSSSSPAPAATQTSAPRRVKYNKQGQKVG